MFSKIEVHNLGSSADRLQGAGLWLAGLLSFHFRTKGSVVSFGFGSVVSFLCEERQWLQTMRTTTVGLREYSDATILCRAGAERGISVR